MGAGSDEARIQDKVTDAQDNLIAAQNHLAPVNAALADRVRIVRKNVQKPLFGEPFSGSEDIERIKQIRKEVHGLFPRAESAEEGHKKSHGDCEGCMVTLKTTVPEVRDTEPELQHTVKGRIAWNSPVPDEIARFREIELHNPVGPEKTSPFSSKKPLIGTEVSRKIARDGKLAKPFQSETVAVVTGFSFLGKVLERGFIEVDKATNMQAKPPHMRPSTWINVGLGVVGLVAGGFQAMGGPWDTGLLVWGAHHLSKAVDYTEEYIPGGNPYQAALNQQFTRQVIPSPVTGPGMMIRTPPTIVA